MFPSFYNNDQSYIFHHQNPQVESGRCTVNGGQVNVAQLFSYAQQRSAEQLDARFGGSVGYSGGGVGRPAGGGRYTSFASVAASFEIVSPSTSSLSPLAWYDNRLLLFVIDAPLY